MAKYHLLLLGIITSYVSFTQSTFTPSIAMNWSELSSQPVKKWTIDSIDYKISGNGIENASSDLENVELLTFEEYCVNGMGHATLSDCMRFCTEESYRNFTAKLETEAKEEDEEIQFEYKLVTLSEGEFSVTPNKILMTRLPIANFTQSSYTIENGKARICYPLSQKFLNCEIWYLNDEDDDFELNNETQKLHVLLPEADGATSYVLDVGDFYFLSDFVAECQRYNERHEEETVANIAFVVAYFISALFLTFTFILSIAIPKLNMRKNTVLLCHMVMLSAAYWTLVVSSLIGTMTITSCTAVSLVRQYTFLSSFLWINVQSIDLYIRFVNLGGQTSDYSSERRRFVYYAVYAWGIPFLFSLVTLIMAMSNATILHPNFAKHCWFKKSDKLTTFVYFYGIIVFVLASNIVLFGLLIFKLHSMSKSVKNVNKNVHKQFFHLYLKLIVVMGLCWIMEVVSWAVGGDNRFWYFTDLVNSLQGLFIFFVYVCKPSCMRTIFRQKRPSWWPWKKNNRTPSSRDNRTEGEGSSKFRSTSTSTTIEQSILLQTMAKQSY